jgi:hypothetical protein
MSWRKRTALLSGLAQYGDGARASARFNVQKHEALKMASPLEGHTLKQRERRFLALLNLCHPVT